MIIESKQNRQTSNVKCKLLTALFAFFRFFCNFISFRIRIYVHKTNAFLARQTFVQKVGKKSTKIPTIFMCPHTIVHHNSSCNKSRKTPLTTQANKQHEHQTNPKQQSVLQTGGGVILKRVVDIMALRLLTRLHLPLAIWPLIANTLDRVVRTSFVAYYQMPNVCGPPVAVYNVWL